MSTLQLSPPPDPEGVGGPLPDNFSQLNEHTTRRPSCGTAMTAFQQVIVEYLPEHGQDPAMWKGRWWRKPLIMSKCSGKTPRDSPKELRQSKPSLSACFAEQADCKELRDDEKQDATACSAGDEL